MVLRLLTMADLDDLAVLYGDPEIRRYFPDGTRTYEQTRAELEWIIDVYYARYGYGPCGRRCSRRPGRSSAECGLLPWEIGGRTEVEVAYLLGKPYWGRGLGTEAARAIADHAFATLPVDRLICFSRSGQHGFAERRPPDRHDAALGRLRRRGRACPRLRPGITGRSPRPRVVDWLSV